MGKIFDKFNNKTYRNEAEVKQNFVIPLLTEFLGYTNTEIIPERNIPATYLNSGVKKTGKTKDLLHRPDYIVCIDGDLDNKKFIVEVKGEKENIDKHFKQLRSYSNSVCLNLIVITNGKQINIFDVNEPLFKAKNIQELDIKFDHLKIILSRETHLKNDLFEIISSVDRKKSLSIPEEDLRTKELNYKKRKLSDFIKYLNSIDNEFNDWQIPENFNGLRNINLQKFNPILLHNFSLINLYDSNMDNIEHKTYSIKEILEKFKGNLTVIVGNLGSGKTTLLKFLTFSDCQECINDKNTTIPIYIELKKINQQNTLENLIKSTLEINSYYINGSLINLLEQNNFTLYLDGYDEIQNEYIFAFQHDLKKIQKIYKCVLSTRNNKIPNIIPKNIFKLNPLTEQKIEGISKKYFGERNHYFIKEIKQKNLNEETQNIFLLLLIISVYKEKKKLPISMIRIIKEVISNIRDWEINKNIKNPLSWNFLEAILSELALFCIENEIININSNDTFNIIKPIIKNFEENREIPSNLTKDNIIDSLCSIGLILSNESGIYFFHRIFVIYFTSIALASRINQDIKNIDSKINYSKWENIIIGSSFFLNDSSGLINLILKNNIWLSSSCLIDAQQVEDIIKDNVINKLINRCNSEIFEIRERALSHLKRIKEVKTKNIFWKLFNESSYVNVKKVAIEEISKEGSSEAKELVIDNINWEEYPEFPLGNSLCSIVTALSNFGEDEIIKIIDIWDTKNDIFMNFTCKSIFIKLFEENRITKKIEERLIKSFFYNIEIEIDKKEISNFSYIIDVMKVIQSLSLFDKLFSILDKENDEYLYYIGELLPSYKSNNEINKIYEQTKSNNKRKAEICSKALSDSSGNIPFEYVKKLIKNDYISIKLNGIRALKKFPFDKVKQIIFELLKTEDNKIQHTLFEVLYKSGYILNIIDDEIFPKKLNIKSFRYFLKSVRKYKIFEAYNILYAFYNNFILDHISDINTFFEFSLAFLSIGEKEKGEELINSLFDNDDNICLPNTYNIRTLINILVEFDQDFASKKLIKIYNQFKNKFEDGYFIFGDFCESVEKIETYELKELVKQNINIQVNKYKKGTIKKLNIARQLGTFFYIGSEEDEDWLLGILNQDIIIDIINKRRAIACLGYIGTDKSLPIIKNTAKKCRDNKLIIDACLFSYESIIRKKGELKEIKDSELFC